MSWTERFDELEDLEPSVRARITGETHILTVPKDTVIFGPGKTPDSLLLLLNGVVRVQQLSEKGREIVLYRVRSGQSCVLTTACFLASEDYTAQGVTETECQAANIPKRLFDSLIAESEPFRQFVFASFSKRITDLITVIEEVAFQRIDIRLAHKLLELANGKSSVHATHQQLAAELGSVREVVSRQLQEFQRRGWVGQSRGSIELLQLDNIKLIADQ